MEKHVYTLAGNKQLNFQIYQRKLVCHSNDLLQFNLLIKMLIRMMTNSVGVGQ